MTAVAVIQLNGGSWGVFLDGRLVSDHRTIEAARIAARRHQGIDTRRAGT